MLSLDRPRSRRESHEFTCCFNLPTSSAMTMTCVSLWINWWSYEFTRCLDDRRTVWHWACYSTRVCEGRRLAASFRNCPDETWLKEEAK